MQRNGGGFFFGQAHTEALVDARHSLGGNLVLCFVQVSQVADVGRLDVDVFLVAVDGKVDVVRQGDDQVAVEIGIDAVGARSTSIPETSKISLGISFSRPWYSGLMP